MNAAHLHLAINHISVFTIPVALIVLTVSLWKYHEALTFSLWLLCGTLLTTLLPFLTGEPAEEIVEELQGVSGALIHSHEEAGEIALYLSLAAAAVTLIAIFLKSKKVKLMVIQLAIALSILTLGSLAYTSSLGGKIRHPEIDIVHQDQD